MNTGTDWMRLHLIVIGNVAWVYIVEYVNIKGFGNWRIIRSPSIHFIYLFENVILTIFIYYKAINFIPSRDSHARHPLLKYLNLINFLLFNSELYQSSIFLTSDGYFIFYFINIFLCSSFSQHMFFLISLFLHETLLFSFIYLINLIYNFNICKPWFGNLD